MKLTLMTVLLTLVLMVEHVMMKLLGTPAFVALDFLVVSVKLTLMTVELTPVLMVEHAMMRWLDTVALAVPATLEMTVNLLLRMVSKTAMYNKTTCPNVLVRPEGTFENMLFSQTISRLEWRWSACYVLPL